MLDRLLNRLGPRYLLAMMLGTRIFGSVSGLLVIFYVELTLSLPDDVRRHFRIGALIVVVIAVTLTTLLAHWETRHVRSALTAILEGRPVDPRVARRVGREAVTFAVRHMRLEAWLVPCTTLLPMLIFLRAVDNASVIVLANITLAVFMGITMALMSTFFAVEYCMAVVIRHLIRHGVHIDYNQLPVGRLRVRFGICFSLLIITTALMIGTLARQRALDIVEGRVDQQQSLENLVVHSTYITITAAIVGIVLSSVMTQSVASRVDHLVGAMIRVGQGDLQPRLYATGNDEIDIVSRQFNYMVEQIDQHHRMVAELNNTLEGKVAERTEQLEVNMRELRDTQAQLIHSEKMNSLGQLVAGVAHELNNSINAVYNGIQPLRAKLESLSPLVESALSERPQEIETYRQRIQRNLASVAKLTTVVESGAARTARIVRDLKTFSHPGQEERAEFDLHELLEASLNLLSTDLKSRIRIIRRFDDGIPRLLGPRDQLHQVMLNILSNAQQAITNTGRIEIVTIWAADSLAITIRDTGSGIDEAVKDRIFDPFFTTKPPGTGTGLGLSISYGIINRLGGSIECDSQVGVGSVFTVRLPLHDEGGSVVVGNVQPASLLSAVEA